MQIINNVTVQDLINRLQELVDSEQVDGDTPVRIGMNQEYETTMRRYHIDEITTTTFNHTRHVFLNW